MGKYSDNERNERDWYPTPLKAVTPLIPYLNGVKNYVEPFVGNGVLVNHLSSQNNNLKCVWAFDIEPQLEPITVTATNDFLVSEQRDFNEMPIEYFQQKMFEKGVDGIITNPPWLNTSQSGYQLTNFVNKLVSARFPVILLLNANIVNNKGFWQNRTYGRSIGDLCYRILPVGRMKWIEGSAHTGKEDCSWFFFHQNNQSHPVILPRK